MLSDDAAAGTPGAGVDPVGTPGPGVDPVLRQVTREVEAHVAASGWDQPARLYALVPTTELLASEPTLAARLGLDEMSAAGTLTPVEQDQVPPDRAFEEVLGGLMWPPQVVGCAAVIERLVLPPHAESQLSAAADGYDYHHSGDTGDTGGTGGTDGQHRDDRLTRAAAEHPDRQEVRMAAAVTRDGRSHCALRLRGHDADVLDAPDLVPALVSMLAQTLTD